MKSLLKHVKKISWVLLVTIAFQLVPRNLYATEGVIAPETSQFEPVDMTDLVNLYTGDFVYNVPLLNIPGPQGSWPISMSYHAGIGPNTEASWVGLGWSLNPGAINRFVTGLPDDYWGGIVQSKFYHEAVTQHGVNVSLFAGPVGSSVNYDSHKGMSGNMSVGFNAGTAKSPLNVSLQAGSDGVGISIAGFSASVNYETGGVSFGMNSGFVVKNQFTVQGGVSYGTKDGVKVNGSVGTYMPNTVFSQQIPSLASGQFSFSSKKATGSTLGIGIGSGFQSQAGNSAGQSSRKERDYVFPIPYGAGSIHTYKMKWWMNEIHQDAGFGSIHQLGYLHKANEIDYANYSLSNLWGAGSNNIISKIRTLAPKNGINLLKGNSSTTFDAVYASTKVERQIINNVIFSSEDVYQVSAQGLMGVFQPYHSWSYKLFDEDNEKTGKFETTIEQGANSTINEYNTGSQIKFRFANETGGNFVSKHIGHGANYNSTGQIAGRIINPAIDLNTGSIIGFEIICPDGKVYEFFQPVYEYYRLSVNRNTSLEDSNHVKTMTPSVVSWLLTGIKGPDYVDVTDNGYSTDDFGYWVKFNYITESDFTAWRAPYNGYQRDNGREEMSFGIKEKYYLSSIETATHIARFITTNRVDNVPNSILKFEVGMLSHKNIGPNANNLRLVSGLTKNVIDQKLLGQFSAKLKIFSMKWTERAATQGVYVIDTDGQSAKEDVIDISLNSYNAVEPYELAAFDVTLPFDNDWNYGQDGYVPTRTGKFYRASLIELTPIGGIYNPPPAKALSRIEIHKKSLLNDNSQKTDYAASYADATLESVDFSYSNTLCPGAPNSQATNKAKLTLDKIIKKGLSDQICLPPTQFTYASNPSYDKYKWDVWNGYSSVGVESYHLNSVNRDVANADANAWNLSSILTPLGSTINIEYESDVIDEIKQQSILSWVSPTSTIYNPNIMTSITSPTGQTTSVVTIGSDLGGIMSQFEYGVRDFVLVEKEHYVTRSTIGYQDGSECVCCDVQEGEQFSSHFVKIISINGNQVTLESPFLFKSPYEDNSSCLNTAEYSYYFRNSGYFGGGHRVKSVSISDGAEVNKTNYRYRFGNTASLPEEYKKTMSVYVSNPPLLSENLNQLIAPPGVGYGEVDVFKYDSQSKSQPNGKTTFSFYTSKDSPSTIEEVSISTNPQVSQLTIKDRSNIVGQLKGTKVYATKPGTNGMGINDLYLLSESTTNFQFSDNINKRFVSPNRSSDFTASTHLPGGTQSKYETKYKSNQLIKVDHQRLSIFQIGKTQTTYLYDRDWNLTGTISSQSDNIEFDGFTGATLTSQSNLSDGKVETIENTPAYWKYDGMKSKNMITQVTSTKSYLSPSGTISAYTADANKKAHLTTSSVTTWRNWSEIAGTYIWRENDVFVATKTGSQYVEFNKWNDADAALTDVFNGWKRASNVTKYDQYSHPVESRSMDGTYVSTKYGYKGTMPIASVQNAQLSEWLYFNFEEDCDNQGASTEAKTGIRSAIYNGSTINGNTIIIPGSGSYRVTAWTKSGSNDWIYYSNTLNAGTTLNIPGSGLIDELKIYPIKASMITFTYNPRSLVLIAVTDANDVISYYEYDDCGRLTRVFDQDKKLLKENIYNYKRPKQ